MTLSQPLKSISQYVPMRDGVRLAVSLWLNETDVENQTRYPIVLITTRYWRDLATRAGKPAAVQKIFYPVIEGYSKHGYRVVVADARGSGASFGVRYAEIDSNEVADIGELIDWVGEQSWCNGQVATVGSSYSGNTAQFSLVTSPGALKLAVCRAPDFDMYRHLFAPGGIVNDWFIKTWGGCTKVLDTNNVTALYADGYFPQPENGAENVIGVRPVDNDTEGSLLAMAVAEHTDNFNIAEQNSDLSYIENFWTENNPPVFDSVYRAAIEKAAKPVVIRCGWHDAGTQLGALSMYATFSTPVHAIIGPWNHEGSYNVDPFQKDDDISCQQIDMAEARAMVIQSLDDHLKSDYAKAKRQVDYYTLGENRWKTTTQWPLPNTSVQRWFCSDNYQLSPQPPISDNAFDQYEVDLTATTGKFNRWYAQASNQPIRFPERREEDKKLLVYDTAPLPQDTEITGHPVVHLYLRCNGVDAQIFAYLEMVDPDGRVRLLTEGQLRGIHRKVSTEPPPYTMFGPYHSLMQKDAEPMVPGEVEHIAFDLLPISVQLKKGQRIRLAIAGADCDTFTPVNTVSPINIDMLRTPLFPSAIDLPIIQQ